MHLVSRYNENVLKDDAACINVFSRNIYLKRVREHMKRPLTTYGFHRRIGFTKCGRSIDTLSFARHIMS